MEGIAQLLDGISPQDGSGSKDTATMDAVCTTILHPVGSIGSGFVGAIVILRVPLPCDMLARLLDVDASETTRTLPNVGSLLAPPRSS